jgi:hypothetical protein
MNTNRVLLFLIGCIGTRTALAVLAKHASPDWLQTMGAFALIPAIGFFTIFMFGLRETGPEVFGEKIWWNSLRPIHGTMYLLFAIFALQKKEFAWMFLAADVTIGLLAYVTHNFVLNRNEQPRESLEM